MFCCVPGLAAGVAGVTRVPLDTIPSPTGGSVLLVEKHCSVEKLCKKSATEPISAASECHRLSQSQLEMLQQLSWFVLHVLQFPTVWAKPSRYHNRKTRVQTAVCSVSWIFKESSANLCQQKTSSFSSLLHPLLDFSRKKAKMSRKRGKQASLAAHWNAPLCKVPSQILLRFAKAKEEEEETKGGEGKIKKRDSTGNLKEGSEQASRNQMVHEEDYK